MSLISVAVLITAIGGPADAPPSAHVHQAQSTNPALNPPGRPGRSYAPPEQSNPGTSSGPLLKAPGYTPRSGPRDGERKGPPTASDCAAGYSSNSGLTRREFNRLCGKGS